MNEVYISGSSDTASNLSYEELLFETLPPASVRLFLYVNGPSVVIGKNQNPWREIDVGACRRKNIPIFRRISGGGTVFHDPGNLNFSFIMAKELYDKEKNIALIRSALDKTGIRTEQSRRGDILLDGRKISGNAMNVKKERVLHHGTLLFDTALDDLKGVLAGSRHMIETKAVKSVSSPVVNIKAIDPGLSMDALIDGIVDAFLDRYPAVDPVRVDTAEAAAARNDIREKYTDWEWTFGRTPQCSVYSDAAPNGGDSRIILHVEKGCIRAVEGLPLPTALEARLAGLPLRCSAVEALLADPALIDGGGSSLRMFSAFLKDLAQF